MPPSSLRRLVASICALSAVAPLAFVAAPGALAAAVPALDGTRAPQTLLADGETQVVVALFSLPGCPFCEVVRRNYLRHLEGSVRGVRVAEYGIADERMFKQAATSADTPQSPAALAKSLGIRIAPTVVFFGEANRELAERLIGYNSPDFYGGYLDARIVGALERTEGR